MLTACSRASPRVQQALLTVARWSHSFAPIYVPVVIVGAGPTGLVLSSLLSQYGVQHMVLERSHQLTQHPQAHYINNRTMEVFRGLGDLCSRVKARSPPLEQWRRFIYCESMASGQLLGQVDHFPGQTVPQDPAVSPEPVTHLSQHRLLPLLLEQAQVQSAAHDGCADIRFSTTVTAISNVEFPHQHIHSSCSSRPPLSLQQQLPDANVATALGGISSTATYDATGRQHWEEEDLAAQEYPVCVALQQQQQQQAGGGSTPGSQLVRCRHLLAADGAHSTVRDLLEIPMLGEPALQHLMSIHFTCPALGQALLQQQRAAMLYFVFNKQLVAVMVAHNLSAGEFVAQVPYYPPLQSPSDFTPEVCKQLIADAAGWPLQQLQQASAQQPGLHIHSVKSWVMSALVAEDYSSWHGRILLVGDAAHRFPPAGGFGMNTGIQDAHNLAWKLAAVLSGKAAGQLLSSYHTERRPVAAANSALSVNNWHEALRVPQALGLDPRAAKLVNDMVSAAPFPPALSRLLLDSALAAGRGLAAAVTPMRKAALEDILRSGQSLRLQFPKEDLGVVYAAGAVAAEGKQQGVERPPPAGSRGRSGPYVPSTTVGGRLPHCNLALLGQARAQQRVVSSLDLVTADRLGLNMLLICSGSRSNNFSNSWIAAGQQLQQQGWPLKLLRILPQSSTTASAALREPGSSNSSSATAHQQVDAVDVDGTWSRLHRDCSGVVLLVRPDGHVAWRKLQQGTVLQPGGSCVSTSKVTGEEDACRAELLWVLQRVLHLQLPPVDS